MSEHEEQKKLFKMFAACKDLDMRLLMTLIYANVVESYGGTKRDLIRGAYFKAEGRKKGILDITIPIARDGYHSFYIEMKVGKNKPSLQQKMWISNLKKQGHKVEVHYSAESAYNNILEYLKS